MTAQEQVDRFRELARSGQVLSLTTGEPSFISDTTMNAIITSVSNAFRFASGKSDLAEIPYEPYADDLHRYAATDALSRGLLDTANPASRARRFVVSVEGRRRARRRNSRESFTPEWERLACAARELDTHSGRRSRRQTHLHLLVRTCGMRGVISPSSLPARATIQTWFEEDGISSSKVSAAFGAYRAARAALSVKDSIADIPDLDACCVRSDRGLRGLADIHDRLIAAGLASSPRMHAIGTLVQIVAPRCHQVVEEFLRERAPRKGREYTKKVWGAVSRFLAAYARLGLPGLERVHPAQLFLDKIETGRDVKASVVDEDAWERDYLSPDETISVTTTQEVAPVYQVLAMTMVQESTKRSPLSISGMLRDGDPLFFTETIRTDVRFLRDIAFFSAQKALFAKKPELKAELTASYDTFASYMRSVNDERQLNGRKRKEALLELVTFPLIICVGLPALRARVLAAKAAWESAMLRHASAEHPAVAIRERRYDALLEKYLVFAIHIADGLRVQNYTHARLGPLGDEQLVVSALPDGSEVTSYCHVLPTFEDGVLTTVRTNFYGKDHKAVKLKVKRRGRDGEWRTRPHHLRSAVVDFDLLTDYLCRVRPKRLVKQGLVPSIDSYSIADDIAHHHFALFVSPEPSSIPYAAVTGAYGTQAISAKFGECLHWICTHVLRRELPTFRSSALKEQYRSLFAAHVSRMLAATYLYGIRGRLSEAKAFIDDTEATIARRYSVVEASLVHKTGWEAPGYANALFDRVWDERSVPIDELPTTIEDLMERVEDDRD